MTRPNPQIAAECKSRRQFTVRALMLAVLFCAVVLVLFLVSRDRLGRWLLRPAHVARSEFSTHEMRQFEKILGVKLPSNSRIDLATISGHRDHEFTVRIRIPGEEFDAFRKNLQMVAAPVSMRFLGEIQSAAPQWRTAALDVDAALQIGNSSQMILCKDVNGTATAYFEAYDWLGADLTGAFEILSAQQSPH